MLRWVGSRKLALFSLVITLKCVGGNKKQKTKTTEYNYKFHFPSQAGSILPCHVMCSLALALSAPTLPWKDGPVCPTGVCFSSQVKCSILGKHMPLQKPVSVSREFSDWALFQGRNGGEWVGDPVGMIQSVKSTYRGPDPRSVFTSRLIFLSTSIVTPLCQRERSQAACRQG